MPPRQAERWRWQLKVAVASAIAGACRLQDHTTGIRGQRPLILGYHRVVEDFESASRTEMASMLISRTMLERHIECIGRKFRFVSLDEIGEHAANGRPFSRPVAAITFDDGYQDVYENAFPLLRRKGIPAGVFVVTDLIGQPLWQVHDKLYHLVDQALSTWKDPRRRLFDLITELQIPAGEIFQTPASISTAMTAVSALLPALPQSQVNRLMASLETCVDNGTPDIPLSVTWPMIHEMRRGGVTIGSHTQSHVSLPMESLEAATRELEESKRVLEQGLGERINHFAYPGGQFTPPVVDALERAGYQFAYTACPHNDPRHPALTLERLLLWERSSIDADGRFSSVIFNCQAHNLWPRARHCERTHQT
jgi:peptidoglycan/xylan/chitin deacetylase (PgdA/CDA1 family)